ncbi:MAG: GDP-mannose 4,6-dehydratase [Phycisphaerales bacterium]
MPTASPILVTGAAGFIGSHVADALLARGDRVVGVDNLDPYYDLTIKQRNVNQTLARAPQDAYHMVEADICDADAMRRVFESHRPAGVIHLAAKAGVRPSIADPVGYARTNVVGTQVMLEEARRAGCARFVMASSSSVYGNLAGVPFREDADVSEPISPYAATKRSCELIGYAHHHLTGMPTACLRFFTVFGPRQRPDLAISRFLSLARDNQPIPMFGDGSTSRDYTYIDDIVRGVLASYDRIDRHGFRVWNLGGSSPTTLREMIATIHRVTGRETPVKCLPSQPGDVERTSADLTRSTAELGYTPTTGFAEGVARQWAWLTAQPAGSASR